MVGRPKKITNQVLGILKQAFLIGCTDLEACLYAEINPDTLYEYQKKNPKYSEEKEMYKSNPFLIARASVIAALKNDPHLALKFLERRKSDEFSLRKTVDQNVSGEAITGFTYIVPDDRIDEYTAHYPNSTVVKKSDYEKQT